MRHYYIKATEPITYLSGRHITDVAFPPCPLAEEKRKEYDYNFCIGEEECSEECVPLVGPMGYRELVIPIMDVMASITRNSNILSSEDLLYYYNNMVGVFNASINFRDEYKEGVVIIVYDRQGEGSVIRDLIPVSLLGEEYHLLFWSPTEDAPNDPIFSGDVYEKRKKRIQDLVNYEGDIRGMNLKEISKILGAWGIHKGFSPDWHMQIQLISSEVAEVAEELRDVGLGHPRVSEELADILIRLVSMCSQFGIDISEEVMKKHQKNQLRGRKHGHKNL